MSATLYAEQVEDVAIRSGMRSAEAMIDSLPVSHEEKSALWLLAWLSDVFAQNSERAIARRRREQRARERRSRIRPGGFRGGS